METVYNKGIATNPSTKNSQRQIYLEQRLTTSGISKMLKFKARFRQYHFEWMTIAPGPFNSVLGYVFYAIYKMELKKLYPQGQL